MEDCRIEHEARAYARRDPAFRGRVVFADFLASRYGDGYASLSGAPRDRVRMAAPSSSRPRSLPVRAADLVVGAACLMVMALFGPVR